MNAMNGGVAPANGVSRRHVDASSSWLGAEAAR
jgi:hypothetical protein